MEMAVVEDSDRLVILTRPIVKRQQTHDSIIMLQDRLHPFLQPFQPLVEGTVRLFVEFVRFGQQQSILRIGFDGPIVIGDCIFPITLHPFAKTGITVGNGKRRIQRNRLFPSSQSSLFLTQVVQQVSLIVGQLGILGCHLYQPVKEGHLLQTQRIVVHG